jgi:hypothetical protein
MLKSDRKLVCKVRAQPYKSPGKLCIGPNYDKLFLSMNILELKSKKLTVWHTAECPE